MANDAHEPLLPSSARTHGVIRSALRDSIKKQYVPGSLSPLLEATYDGPTGKHAKAVFKTWSRDIKLQPGGTF
jgi:hypothetical protein